MPRERERCQSHTHTHTRTCTMYIYTNTHTHTCTHTHNLKKADGERECHTCRSKSPHSLVNWPRIGLYVPNHVRQVHVDMLQRLKKPLVQRKEGQIYLLSLRSLENQASLTCFGPEVVFAAPPLQQLLQELGPSPRVLLPGTAVPEAASLSLPLFLEIQSSLRSHHSQAHAAGPEKE